MNEFVITNNHLSCINNDITGILALNLHEFTGDVEDICDQAAKELKIENSIQTLSERWKSIEWIMEHYKVRGLLFLFYTLCVVFKQIKF